MNLLAHKNSNTEVRKPYYGAVYQKVMNFLTADVVKVVRCGKCKHGDVSVHSRTKDGQEEVACYCNLKNAVTDIDGFCSSSERRTKRR